MTKMIKTPKMIITNLPGNRNASRRNIEHIAIGVSDGDETISQLLEACPDMMLKDFNLSKRSSLNVTRKLTDRRWLPILKSSSPLNALMTTLLNQLQNEKIRMVFPPSTSTAPRPTPQ
jgi:chemotaxis response regulator CheB